MNEQWQRIGIILAAAAIAALVAGLLLFTAAGLPGNDGHYHITIASLIWQNGLTFNFPWLPLTLLDPDHYVDMHMLYHLLQSPFTALLEPADAARASATAFVAVAAGLLAWLLYRYEVPWPLLWVLLLLIVSDSFLYRMMMSRPPVFALIYTWLAFHCLMQRKHLALAAVACLFAWTYKVFPILLPLAVIGMFVHWLERREFDIRPLLAVAVGIVVGLLLNPYFPDNIGFLWKAIQMKILAGDFEAHVGNEWYPLDTLELARDAGIALAAYLFGLLLTDRDEWARDPARLFWFLVATMWLLMLFKSRRFIEFFSPSALMFLAFSMRPWLQQYRFRELLQRYRAGSVIVLLLLLAGGFNTLSHAYQRMQDERPVSSYAGATAWLKANTPAGSRVFHTDWDDFPKLFFHDRHNIYLVGLDPDYMRLPYPGHYDIWRLISRGQVPHPEDRILGEFECRYVFTDTRHRSFMRVAEKSPRMQQVYADDDTRIYRVLDVEEMRLSGGDVSGRSKP